MTDVFKITFGHYQQLLARAKKGDDNSAIRALSDLRNAVENSDMDQDAVNALSDLLNRALENKEARNRLILKIPVKTQRLRERNEKIIDLVSVASVMGCSLSKEGDAFEWAANRYNKYNNKKVTIRNVERIWNGQDTPPGLHIGVSRDIAKVIGNYLEAQGEFCPVYFGPNEFDLGLYVEEFPELEMAARQILDGLEVRTTHCKAFAKAWLLHVSYRSEITPV